MTKKNFHHIYLLALLISAPLAAMEVNESDTSNSMVLVLDATLIPAFKIAYTDLVEWGNKWGSQPRSIPSNAFAIDTLKLCYFTSLLQTKDAPLRIHRIVEPLETSPVSSPKVILSSSGLSGSHNYKNMLCIELSANLEHIRQEKIKTLMNGLQVLTGPEAKAYLNEERHKSEYCSCTSYNLSNQRFIEALKTAIPKEHTEVIENMTS